MKSALIGATGFIGSNLLTQRKWDRAFNTKNICQLEREYDLVVCAAAPGAKWIANLLPINDENKVNNLIDHLYRIQKAQRFVLISTADVFSQPVVCCEADRPNPDCAYGKNRLLLEEFVRKLFPHAQIVRLPGVDGPGLKKNALYDLRHEQYLDLLNPASVYQWYDVTNLWKDIEHRTEPIIHLCPKPESLAETVERDFPHLKGKLTGTGTPVKYDLRTIYPITSSDTA